MMAFSQLLDRFACCVESNDGTGLGALFTPDGVYEDYFFGAHQGAAAIAAMLARFHEGGTDYRWEFHDPLCDGQTGYARYRFSYRSRLEAVLGQPIAFEGMSCFTLRDGMIAHYAEVFDRGVAFVQMGFAPGKVARLLEKYAIAQNAQDGFQPHLRRLQPPGAR